MSAAADLTGLIMRYEEGDLIEEEALTLFQRLVDTGLAWRLQGHYGRTAQTLIAGGYINGGEVHS